MVLGPGRESWRSLGSSHTKRRLVGCRRASASEFEESIRLEWQKSMKRVIVAV